MTALPKRRVADLVVDLLTAGGVTDWFGVAGTTVMPLLEAISHDGRVRYHSARHEHVAMDMASGYARASSRLGVCMTHVGPGVTNTVTSLVTAARDRVPVLLISGNEESWTLIRRPYHDWPATAALAPTAASNGQLTFRSRFGKRCRPPCAVCRAPFIWTFPKMSWRLNWTTRAGTG